MKIFHRKVSLLVAAMIVLVLALAACGGNNNDDTTVTTANGGAAATETTPPPPPAATDTPVAEETPLLGGIHQPRDMGGRTIMAGAYWMNSMPYSVPHWEEPDPAVVVDYHRRRLIFDNSRRVMREFNVNFDSLYIPIHDIASILTTSVLGGAPVADIVRIDGNAILTAVLGDLLVPFSEIDLPNSDIMGPAIYGHIAVNAFGEDWTFAPNSVGVYPAMIGINLDIINAIGAPNPVDLFNQGRWTWDAALEIMRMATRDTTGDGVTDQFGISGQPADLIRHFIAANDGVLICDDFNYALDHPNTVEAFEFVNTFFTEGLWNYCQVGGPNAGDWGRNAHVFAEGQTALFHAFRWLITYGGRDLPFEFAAVPYPLGPSNTTGLSWSAAWASGFGFPRFSSWDPVDLLTVQEELLSWPGYEIEIMTGAGLVSKRNIWLTEADVQRELAAAANVNRCIGITVPRFYWVFGAFAQDFLSGDVTVMQAIEAHRPPQQELLDSFFR